MRKLMIIAVLGAITLGTGCQLNLKGPEVQASIFRKDENGGEIHKSRSSNPWNKRLSAFFNTEPRK